MAKLPYLFVVASILALTGCRAKKLATFDREAASTVAAQVAVDEVKPVPTKSVLDSDYLLDEAYADSALYTFSSPTALRMEYSEAHLVASDDDSSVDCASLDYTADEPKVRDALAFIKNRKICGEGKIGYCLRLSAADDQATAFAYLMAPPLDIDVPCPNATFAAVSMRINEGALVTDRLLVNLQFDAPKVVREMVVSSKASCKEGNQWQRFATSLADWPLPKANAENTVYAAFKDAFGNVSDCISAKIMHQEANTAVASSGLASESPAGASAAASQPADPQPSPSAQASLVTIAVTPAAPSLGLGASQQFTATGTYSNATTANLTNAVTWLRTNGTGTATITAGGNVTATAIGSVTITATLGGVSGLASLTVTSPTVVSIAVTPSAATVALNATQQYTATATYSDGSTANISSTATWTRTNGSGTATISASGLVTPTASGSVTISATSGSVTGQSTLTVVGSQLGASISQSATGASHLPTQTIPTPTTIYYIDGTTGVDTNSGLSEADAWKTLSKAAASSLSPGDQVYVKNGTYREMVTPVSSGLSGSPIIYRAYPGHSPVISGADAFTAWTSLGVAENLGTDGIFVSSLEDATFGDFNSTSTDNSHTLTLQSSVVNHGSGAARIVMSGTGAGTARMAANITAVDTLHVRVYFRFSGLSWSSPSCTTSAGQTRVLSILNGTSTRLASLRICEESGATKLRLYNEGTSAQIGARVAISANTWYYLEMRYKTGSGTGEMQAWIDGVSMGSSTNLTNSNQASRVEVGVSSGPGWPVANSTFYYDDLKLAGSSIGAFSAAGNSAIYRLPNVSWTLRQVFVDGTRATAVAALSDLATSDASSHRFYFDATNHYAYVRLANDVSPSGRLLELSRRAQVFNLTGLSYLSFYGFTVRQSNTSTGGGFLLTNSSHVNVVQNTITQHYGSGVYGVGTTNAWVAGNSMSDNDRDFGGGVRFDDGANNNTIEYNTISGSGGNGVNIRGDNTASADNIIRYNDIHDVYDSGIYLHTNVSNTQIIGNFIKNAAVSYVSNGNTAGGNGIHVSLGSTQTLVKNNIVSSVYSNGILLRESADRNKVYQNTVYNVGLKGSGSCFGVQTTSSGGPGSAQNTLINNICMTAQSACVFMDAESITAGGNSASYNLCYNPGQQAWIYNSTNYATLALAYAGFGLEAHGVDSNPLFNNAAGNDFGLASGSPGQSAGGFLP